MSSVSNHMDGSSNSWAINPIQMDVGLQRVGHLDSPKIALALGNLSLLAYSGADDIKKYLTNHGFTGGFRFLSGDNTFGFVARLTDSATSPVFIAYRGTEPTMLAEVVADIDYAQVALNGLTGKVHGGFGRAFSSVK